MAHGEGALNASVVAVGLVQSGGIAGQDMTATVRLAESDVPELLKVLAQGLLPEQQTAAEAG